MKMRNWTAALVALLFLVAGAPAEDKPGKETTEALAKAFKDADTVFTAEIGKVQPLGQTNSIPASVFGNVTFKNAKALRGAAPEGALSYSFREGSTTNLDLEAVGKVLVATKGKGVLAVVPTTEANLALVKKADEPAKDK